MRSANDQELEAAEEEGRIQHRSSESTVSRWQAREASPNAGTRYRRPSYLRCSHSFRNATATANALKNAKMVANIG
jgi:hypothetical protein